MLSRLTILRQFCGAKSSFDCDAFFGGSDEALTERHRFGRRKLTHFWRQREVNIGILENKTFSIDLCLEQGFSYSLSPKI